MEITQVIVLPKVEKGVHLKKKTLVTELYADANDTPWSSIAGLNNSSIVRDRQSLDLFLFLSHADLTKVAPAVFHKCLTYFEDLDSYKYLVVQWNRSISILPSTGVIN